MALIDIGSQKQLFVDDYLIESLTNTRQVMNPAAKVETNPVLRAERPWEGTEVNVNQVLFDEQEQIFKMWYRGRTMRARQGAGEIIVEGEHDGVQCLPTSKDGIEWERPVLGLVEYEGSTENNILPTKNGQPSAPGFQDPHDQDPSRRYKATVSKGSTSTAGMTIDLFYSPDGFDWTPYHGNPVIDTSPRIGRWGPTSWMGWDPIRGVYAVHMENCLHRRCPQGKRIIGRAESPNMIDWTDAETIIMPDEDDPPDTEFYNMPAFTYEGLYVGLLWIFRTTNTTHHPEIVFSRDGIRYDRAYREPFIPRGAQGEFDSTSLYAQQSIVRNDHILTYYTGTNWRSPEMLLEIGDKATRAIGLAVTPSDGFVSLDGAKGGPSNWTARDVEPFSQMVTRAFTFTGSRLQLNLASALQQWGAEPCEVRVQVLSPNHEPLAGFGLEDADPITSSGQSQVVTWNGSSDVSGVAGKAIKLRFAFKNAKLFSFQFV